MLLYSKRFMFLYYNWQKYNRNQHLKKYLFYFFICKYKTKFIKKRFKPLKSLSLKAFRRRTKNYTLRFRK